MRFERTVRQALLAMAGIAAATGVAGVAVGCRRHGAKAPKPSATAAPTGSTDADGRYVGSADGTPGQPGDPVQPASSSGAGTCAASCAHYLDCKGSRDARQQETCVGQCAKLGKSQQDMAQFERLPCAQAIAAIDGASPPGARGAMRCPAPTAETRTPQEEQIFTAVTTRRFCGWTYNQHSGVSKAMQLVFLPDGVMQHGVKAERSLLMKGPTGASAGMWYANSSGATSYCWKYTGGQMLYSSDGVAFSNFVTKVEDNGHGVIFVKTQLGEYKACD